MTKVYVMLTHDRHTEVEVEVYTDKDRAIEQARQAAMHSAGSEDDYEEEKIDGYLFSASYSCEGDHITVEETDLI